MGRPRKESPPEAVWIAQSEAARRLQTSTPRLIGMRKRGKFAPGIFDEDTAKYHWPRLQEAWAQATLDSGRGGRLLSSGTDTGAEQLQRERAEADKDTAVLRAQQARAGWWMLGMRPRRRLFWSGASGS